jgi:hypothetical protein
VFTGWREGLMSYISSGAGKLGDKVGEAASLKRGNFLTEGRKENWMPEEPGFEHELAEITEVGRKGNSSQKVATRAALQVRGGRFFSFRGNRRWFRKARCIHCIKEPTS